jgi:hypothetical protein
VPDPERWGGVVTLDPMSWSRRPLAALALCALLVAGAAACSDDDEAGPDGTASPATTSPAPTTATTSSPGTTGQTTTTSQSGGPVSSLPPTDPQPGSGDACATLAGTLALQDLLPREGLSWSDERSRVVTDARLSAQLYAQAAGQLPGAEGQYATMLSGYATFVADQTQDAESAGAARTAIDTYEQQGEVAAANTELDRWRGVNCD